MDTATRNLSNLWEGWTPPPGLSRSTPRPVRWSVGGIAIIVVAILMACGGVGGAIAINAQRSSRLARVEQFRENGQTAEGVVTRLWQTGSEDVQYRVAYRFTADDSPYGGQGNLSRRNWKSLKMNGPIEIRYLPANPRQNRPLNSASGVAPVWIPCLFGAILLSGSALFLLILGGRRHLLAEGKPAPAIVTRNRQVYSGEGGSHNEVCYEFPLVAGGTAKGRSNRRPKPTGTLLCVLYDPDNPRRNAIYPTSLVKLDRD
jgi:hypothetical protein